MVQSALMRIWMCCGYQHPTAHQKVEHWNDTNYIIFIEQCVEKSVYLIECEKTSFPCNMNSNEALQIPMAVDIEIWSSGMTVCSVSENLFPFSCGYLARSWRHIPEAHNLNIHHSKNYKSHMRILVTVVPHLFSWNSFTSRLVRFKFRFLAAHPVWLYILPTLSSTFRTAP